LPVSRPTVESQEIFKFVLRVNGRDESVHDTLDQAKGAAKARSDRADLLIYTMDAPNGPVRTRRWYYDRTARAWVERP
jgi:hypothetical protein